MSTGTAHLYVTKSPWDDGGDPEHSAPALVEEAAPVAAELLPPRPMCWSTTRRVVFRAIMFSEWALFLLGVVMMIFAAVWFPREDEVWFAFFMVGFASMMASACSCYCTTRAQQQ
jgi:hypothetical protein